MRVLIVNRFFGGAQIPTGRMAQDVALKLAAAGHEVTALASSGEYAGAVAQARDQEPKRPKVQEIARDESKNSTEGIHLDQVYVPRWVPRTFAWIWFSWQARKRIPRVNWDVCVLMTDPPLLPLLARHAARPRDDRRVAVWLMDLYPEALAASGRLAASNPIYKWYLKKRQRALGMCDLLICLGQAQKERLETKRPKYEKRMDSHEQEPMVGSAHAEQVRTAVIPPWDDRGNIALATESSLQNLALYAGNLGEAHCFEEILAAARHLPSDWTIRFAVRGAKLSALRAKAIQSGHGNLSHGSTRMNTDGVRAVAPTGLGGNARAGGPPALAVSPPNGETGRTSRPRSKGTTGAEVEITGYANEADTPGLLASARVHLITMSPGWEGIVVPSKLYGCIRTGRPVLFVGPEDADTAREIRRNDWGEVLPPGASGKDVATAILKLATRPTRATEPQNGAKKVSELINTLATDRHG